MQAAFTIRCRSVGDLARISDEADGKEHAFHFCPDCGSQHLHGADRAGHDRRVGRLVLDHRSRLRRTRVRLSPSSLAGLPGRSSGTPPSCGTRCDLSARPAGTRMGRTRAASDRGLPGPGIPLLQRVVLREPRGACSRRDRAPAERSTGGRAVRHGEGGLRLRRDPRRPRSTGSARHADLLTRLGMTPDAPANTLFSVAVSVDEARSGAIAPEAVEQDHTASVVPRRRQDLRDALERPDERDARRGRNPDGGRECAAVCQEVGGASV